jgi:hypothetical protein
MGALICNYLPDEASGVHEFSTIWIHKTATFNLTPSGVTSVLTLTVSCVLNRPSWPLLRGSFPGTGGKQIFSVNFHRFGLGDAGGPIDSRVGDLCNHVGPIDSRVGDLCNHVGFTDVAAPRGCWRLFEQKKSPDSRSPIFERKVRKN